MTTLTETDTKTDIILVVDDSPTNLGVLSNTLASANFTVAVALNGEQAIEQVKYKAPDLILLDVMMPGIDGFETCKRLKDDPLTRDIPIIFMTALSDVVDKVKGLSLGAVDYITKPFQQEEVIARIQVHLEVYHLTQTLEQKVAERTSELTQALQNLRQMQVQLIQREKMALLGQVISGVVHEISNPVNFIYGNLNYAYQYISDLLELVHLYQQETPQPSSKVQEFQSEIELEFLQEDLPKTITSMQGGIARIHEIIQALENFRRPDESLIKSVDLHEGLESILVILANRLKYKSYRPAIDIVKTYQDLPVIQCYVLQINQVLMTLLSYAVDAIDNSYKQDHPPSKSPVITIETQCLTPERIEIRISHNGQPLSEQQKHHLLNLSQPDISSKEEDWGLFVTHQIITAIHCGDFRWSSEPQRTVFMIELPTRLQDLNRVN